MKFSPMQREIVRAIELQGGITSGIAERNGWTLRGQPVSDFKELVYVMKIVAPRVQTSIPLTLVWQFRSEATKKDTLAKIEKQARLLGIKEYAPGGFQLTTREQDRAKR